MPRITASYPSAGIKSEIEASGLSYHQVAQLAGCHLRSVYRIRDGHACRGNKVPLSIRVALNLHRAEGCDFEAAMRKRTEAVNAGAARRQEMAATREAAGFRERSVRADGFSKAPHVWTCECGYIAKSTQRWHTREAAARHVKRAGCPAAALIFDPVPTAMLQAVA